MMASGDALNIRGGIGLIHRQHIRHQRGNIAAFVTGRKIRPVRGAKIDFETSQMPISAVGITRNILMSLQPTIRQYASHDGWQIWQRMGVNRTKVDAIHGRHQDRNGFQK